MAVLGGSVGDQRSGWFSQWNRRERYGMLSRTALLMQRSDDEEGDTEMEMS